MFRDGSETGESRAFAADSAGPAGPARSTWICSSCCFGCCEPLSHIVQRLLGREHRYTPAFPDNRPDSSSRSSSHYIAPSDPARELSATGQGAVTSEPEGSALLGKGQPSSTELQEAGTTGRENFAGPNDTRLHRRIQSAGQIAKLAESKAMGDSPRVPKLGSGLTLAPDDEDACPTCLEPYSDDNPKILTQCQHHFHLACIYEWLERSQTCPICSRQMSFDELL